MATTPTVLYNSSAAGATPFIAGQAPGPDAATAASVSDERAGMVARGPAASGLADTGDIASTPDKDSVAPDMFKMHTYFKSIQCPRKNFPSQITFILQVDLTSKKALKFLQDTQEEKKQNFY
ncbi:hypothetical protein BT96DRAFT_991993 [Gymnopus androsaceus JB14]|uniref:Uncharacterized protein n=1 Tax=Gymnopus androsaceus JB14 TaxID=1447944 RepID=A0A6A4HRC3_9AGAR|nr:hypothetical protein BT96DRAFT_991993 [Gymnopus androsaceus JB14]